MEQGDWKYLINVLIAGSITYVGANVYTMSQQSSQPSPVKAYELVISGEESSYIEPSYISSAYNYCDAVLDDVSEISEISKDSLKLNFAAMYHIRGGYVDFNHNYILRRNDKFSTGESYSNASEVEGYVLMCGIEKKSNSDLDLRNVIYEGISSSNGEEWNPKRDYDDSRVIGDVFKIVDVNIRKMNENRLFITYYLKEVKEEND